MKAFRVTITSLLEEQGLDRPDLVQVNEIIRCPPELASVVVLVRGLCLSDVRIVNGDRRARQADDHSR